MPLRPCGVRPAPITWDGKGDYSEDNWWDWLNEGLREGLPVGLAATGKAFSFGLYSGGKYQDDPYFETSYTLAVIGREAALAALTAGGSSGGGSALRASFGGKARTEVSDKVAERLLSRLHFRGKFNWGNAHGERGWTDPHGVIWINLERNSGSFAQAYQTLRHELVHQTFRASRAGKLTDLFYNHSSVWRYGEEALAETIATGSPLRGFVHPWHPRYRILPGLVREIGGPILILNPSPAR